MEVWKDIKGYEGLYECSNLGHIKNIQRNRLLSLPVKRKYKQCTLSKNDVKSYYFVHRIVAELFIENKYNKEQVNHIDGDKLNNNVLNLEWCTRSENQLHAFKTGLQKSKRGEATKASKTILQLSTDGFIIDVFDSYMIAQQKTNINRTCIFECVTGKQKTAGGYLWK